MSELAHLRRRLALRTRLRRALGRRAPPPAAAPEGRTSVTDHVGYTAFCAAAAGQSEVFAAFKGSPVYREVLEHVTPEQGKIYLARVLEQSPELVPLFDRFRENDRLGSPATYDYGEHGRFSPTTLRYAKVLSDLLLLFGRPDGWTIAEIGCGYGGQCFVVSTAAKPASYALIDLDECRALQRVYLERLGVAGTQFPSPDELDPDASYDLVISNYAFSECRREVQQHYLDSVLGRARRGYVTCNWIAPPGYETFTRDELLEALPGSTFLPEVPRTAPANALLVWGHSDEATDRLDARHATAAIDA
jgi:hypothetical protein